MKVVIKNCNSIVQADIEIEQGRLNIKYGPNGTGKSTLARAIEASIKGEEAIKELTPFMYIGQEITSDCESQIEMSESVESISTFNESYIEQFVFQHDEVVQNSFEIFVKSREYDERMNEIESLISSIKATFEHDDFLKGAMRDLLDLSECFGRSKSGYSAASKIGKGIGKGNKIENIPSSLEAYRDYLKSSSNVKWIKWQISGNDFLDISEACPYCTAPIEERKSGILSVAQEYDAKSVEHLNNILAIVERLGRYFSKDAKQDIDEIIRNKVGLKKEEINYLKQIKEQVDVFRGKLSDLKSMTFFSFKDVDKVINKINSLKINIHFLPSLDSEETRRIAETINSSLDTVLTKAGLLQGKVNKQKGCIQKSIQQHKEDINSFLKYAGYKYSVDIENDGESYKMKLKHEDFNEAIPDARKCLSYGEKNAFALVLFMYECLLNNPSLIILDDPISSFDRNKKFAIVEMLFRGKRSFKGKTVLMLTHDLEPIIDMVKNLNHIFDPRPRASFLKSKRGVVNEVKIEEADVMSFGQVCEENVLNTQEDIIKVIYLRRHYEILNDKGMVYHLLSSLLHRREFPTVGSSVNGSEMSGEAIENASAEIEKKIENFSYPLLLTKVKDRGNLLAAYKTSRNNYEKLQLFRMVNEKNHENNIISKFINETFHIENEYIMQLNPCKYDFIPDFIIDECNKSLFGS